MEQRKKAYQERKAASLEKVKTNFNRLKSFFEGNDKPIKEKKKEQKIQLEEVTSIESLENAVQFRQDFQKILQEAFKEQPASYEFFIEGSQCMSLSDEELLIYLPDPMKVAFWQKEVEPILRAHLQNDQLTFRYVNKIE